MKTKTSETLAAIIVAHRILKSYHQESRQAMIELMIRRNNGDTFDFEKYIEEKQKEIITPTNQINKDLLQKISVIKQEQGKL